MTFRTRTLIQSSVIALLAVLLILHGMFSETSVRARENQKPVVPGLKPESISRIVIMKDGAETDVSREMGSWMVQSGATSYPASTEKIGTFLDELRTMKTLRIASANQSSWKTFGVDSPENGSISLYTGKDAESIRIVVGLAAGGNSTAFIRINDDKTVYEAGYSLRRYLEEKPVYWQDLKILPAIVTEEAITGVAVKADIVLSEGSSSNHLSEEYRLERAQEGRTSVWSIAGKDMEADQKEVTDLVKNIATLEAADFRPPVDIGKPSAELRIMTGTGKEYRIVFGDKNGDRYPVQLEGSSYSYSVSEWRVGRLLRPLSSLIRESSS